MAKLPGSGDSFRLTAPQFDQLAAGHGAIDSIRILQAAQLSRTMLLLKWLATEDSALSPAALRLAAAQDADPDAVRPILSHPWLSVWAIQRVRGAAADRPDYLPFAALAATMTTTGDSGPELPAAYHGLIPLPGTQRVGHGRPPGLRRPDGTGSRCGG